MFSTDHRWFLTQEWLFEFQSCFKPGAGLQVAQKEVLDGEVVACGEFSASFGGYDVLAHALFGFWA